MQVISPCPLRENAYIQTSVLELYLYLRRMKADRFKKDYLFVQLCHWKLQHLFYSFICDEIAWHEISPKIKDRSGLSQCSFIFFEHFIKKKFHRSDRQKFYPVAPKGLLIGNDSVLFVEIFITPCSSCSDLIEFRLDYKTEIIIVYHNDISASFSIEISPNDTSTDFKLDLH